MRGGSGGRGGEGRGNFLEVGVTGAGRGGEEDNVVGVEQMEVGPEMLGGKKA